MQTFDAIVAGAGIWGCTVARRLAEAGKRVLVLEKRAAMGGNCRCEIDPETGIEEHTYGRISFTPATKRCGRSSIGLRSSMIIGIAYSPGRRK